MLKHRIWSIKYDQYIEHGEFFIIDDGHLYEIDRSDLYVKVDESNYIVEYGIDSLFVGDIIRDLWNDEVYEVMFGEHYINVNGGEYTIDSIGFYLKGDDYQMYGARQIVLDRIKIIGNIHTDKR